MATPFTRTTRSLEADSARTAIIVWTVGGVVLAAWLLWFFLGRVDVVEVSKAARLEVRQASHAVAALAAGRLATSTLAIGRVVHVGEVLAELDAGGERLRMQEEEAHLRALPARVAALREEIAALEAGVAADRRAADSGVDAAKARVREVDAGLVFAEDNERRMAREAGSGSIAEIDALRAKTELHRQSSSRDALVADARKLGLDADTRALRSRAQIESLKSALASLDGEFATTRALVDRLGLAIERHRLRAPVDGVVAEIQPTTVGSFVTEGQKLATIVPSGDLVVVAEFAPTSAFGRVEAGQHARMRLDGYPWAQYGTVDAVVARVSGEWHDNALRVELVPQLAAQGGPPMRHGLTGVVEVDVEHAAPAMLLLRATGQRLAKTRRDDVALGAPR